jgi:hypothetical protein
MVRPEVCRALPALNKLHDNLKAKPTSKAVSYRINKDAPRSRK